MDPHPATLDEAVLLADCTAQTTRRSGPGGQHRNKVETAVVLTHQPTGISAEANERRSQQANHQQALERLRLRLAVELRSPNPAAEPSPLWQSRTAGGRISVSAGHRDFPALVAEALDQLAACDFDSTTAAERLQVTGSQLLKLLRKAPAAYTIFNDQRRARGLRPLK